MHCVSCPVSSTSCSGHGCSWVLEDKDQLLLLAKASANIMDASAAILEEFKTHGGTVTVRQGAAKAEFDQLLADKVFPALSGMVGADLLKAAQAFPAN